ncbi:hypothetical protein GCM10007079_28110 [Nocardiopsis terrae]|nr:hypothetical protein GCM10007079_28110 [Nocardiopsis terrae]
MKSVLSVIGRPRSRSEGAGGSGSIPGPLRRSANISRLTVLDATLAARQPLSNNQIRVRDGGRAVHPGASPRTPSPDPRHRAR